MYSSSLTVELPVKDYLSSYQALFCDKIIAIAHG